MKRVYKISIVWIISILLLPFIISWYLFYTVNAGDNDCMKTYVENIKNNWYTWGAFYKTPGNYHIDIYDFPEYELIGKVKWCNFYDIKEWYKAEAIFNEIYCNTSYFLTK